jgi:hypothetical protein
VTPFSIPRRCSHGMAASGADQWPISGFSAQSRWPPVRCRCRLVRGRKHRSCRRRGSARNITSNRPLIPAGDRPSRPVPCDTTGRRAVREYRTVRGSWHTGGLGTLGRSGSRHYRAGAVRSSPSRNTDRRVPGHRVGVKPALVVSVSLTATRPQARNRVSTERMTP